MLLKMATKTETEDKEVDNPLENQNLNTLGLKFPDDNLKLQPTRKRCVSTSILISPSPKKKKKDGQNIIPPKKFLLGGNISDPLNLNSLQDEDINRAMNKTPKSSPLHSNTVNIKKDQVNVIIPRNLSDPLELSSTSAEAKSKLSADLAILKQKTPQKRKPKKLLPKCLSDFGSLTENIPENDDVPIYGNDDKERKDEISPPNKKSKPELPEKNRTFLEAEKNVSSVLKDIIEKIKEALSDEISLQSIKTCDIPTSKTTAEVVPGKIEDSRKTPLLSTEKNVKIDKEIEEKHDKTKSKSCTAKTVPQHSLSEKQDKAQEIIVSTSTKPKQKFNRNEPKFKEKNSIFKFGNYNRYYGYRNSDEEDNRLKVLAERMDLFYGKEVLDIGCNIGHVSFSVARDFGAKSVVGMDIDRKLINIARKNVQYYINDTKDSSTHLTPNYQFNDNASSISNDPYNNIQSFPISFPMLYGPIDLAGMTISGRFPFNISFIQGNYVLESDVMLSMETSKFDVILCLSITKWIHLNWGDDGLKRAFKRMYAQLRPGGTLVVEPQPWKSYSRKKTLTETIWRNYKNIKLRPPMFTEYLINEVGFANCETLAMPYNPSKGFQRPLKLYRKPSLLTTRTVPTCTIVQPNKTQKS